MNDLQNDTGHVEETPKTMPLSQIAGEELPEADHFEISGHRGRAIFNQSTILALLFLAISGGVIYAMRLSQGPIEAEAASETAETKIDEAIELFTRKDPSQDLDDLFADTDNVIAMFSSDLTQRQVPLEYLHRNPFLTTANGDENEDGQETSSGNKTVSSQARRDQLETELAGLRLQTVILGRINVAVIDGDMTQVGQNVGSFKVVKINQASVEVTAEGQRFTLSMGG